MPDHDHPEHVCSRVRNIWHDVLNDGYGDEEGTPIAVDHLYLPDGSFTCEDCGAPGHDPGMGVLRLGDEAGLMDVGELLTLADRLRKVADLILESRMQPPDMDREAHKFGVPVEPPRTSFKPGDVIAVPPEVVRVTGFRPSSRLIIKRRKASQRQGTCKSCGTPIGPGDLYAAASEPASDRCIRCVDGWPLASERMPG
jgi:hypothetical protein